jgi:ankyrin repeat protein
MSVRRAVDRGANPNTTGTGLQLTPLMLAAASELAPVDVVRMLIENGADIHAKSPAGQTALDFARRQGETSVVSFLIKAGATATARVNEPAAIPKPAGPARSAIERSIPLLQRADVTRGVRTNSFLRRRRIGP